ncbi:hypothetical protein Rhopal_002863-T1 [Rhodotorula paludigena]|uniref:Uncharacterized protein n=1 Tax=Rhodotorula paludigena TaxID=86838 RepID=A0AAV5GHF1_9BASI|nr:hypothetical protein Rhopal_002863-T1 [Rhodotorula paludigena]
MIDVLAIYCLPARRADAGLEAFPLTWHVKQAIRHLMPPDFAHYAASDNSFANAHNMVSELGQSDERCRQQ